MRPIYSGDRTSCSPSLFRECTVQLEARVFGFLCRVVHSNSVVLDIVVVIVQSTLSNFGGLLNEG